MTFLLLADVFEKFRNSSLKNYGLRPSHYLGVSALSWDVMLNMAKVELELISDADMYLSFEKGMKGRVSCISKRYSKASNKYLKSCEPKQGTILYTWTLIIYMAMLCLNFFQQADSNG